jgi:DNA primase
MRAILNGEFVLLLEGEKDCDRAQDELGIVATTSPMGAGKWRSSYTHALRGAHIVFVPDNDPTGRQHVLGVAAELQAIAANVKVVELPDLPEKGDLSDWIDAGGTREEFERLISETPQFILPTIESKFGEKAFLPVKSLREIVAEAEETPEWIVRNLLKKG